MELEEILDLCQQLGELGNRLKYQSVEIQKWRERFLAETPILNPTKGSFVWNCFLAIPSQAICEDGIDKVYENILTSIHDK